MKPAGLVVGAGISGIQAALELAERGFTVYLVEKNPSIGGRAAQLSKTFPDLDCFACTLTPKMLEVDKHRNIRLLTYSEVKDVRRDGKIFRVKILRKPRYVDETKCTGCGVCAQHCPVEVANDFDERIGVRNAIYVPFPNAVPQVYVVDKEHCLKCDLCRNVCTNKAVNLQQRPEPIEVEVGAIIVATGYNPFDPRKNEEYGFGKYDNVITGLTLERLLTPSGPTGGHVLRLSDGKIPQKVAFIQCVGPKGKDSGNLYCSKVCCMYATKMAELLKEQVPSADITIYYPDALAKGDGFDEFYERAKNEFGVKFQKAQLNEVVEKPARDLLLRLKNIESNENIEDQADMVVLSTGLVPAASGDFGGILSLKTGIGNFLEAVDSKKDSVTTDVEGVFVAGVAEAPKDISKSMEQAHVAALRAFFVLEKLEKSDALPVKSSK